MKAGSWLLKNFNFLDFEKGLIKFLYIRKKTIKSKIMEEYSNFFESLIIISIIMAALTLAATDPKKHKIIRITLFVIAAIFLIAGLGGYFLITVSNVGSYRY